MFLNNNIQDNKYKFINYTFSIKKELLNQIINNNSNSRIYFDIKYDELLYKYLDSINSFNYNNICNKFVHDIYHLIPVTDTI